MSLTKAESKGLGFSFGVLGILGGARSRIAPWRGKPCEARRKRKSKPPCGKPASTVRVFEAAPGMWVHVVLCHRHGYVWDQAEDWGGGIPHRELSCNGGCPGGKCRGEEEARYHLWFTESELEDAHAGVNHLYDEDTIHFSRCGREGIKEINTQLKAALRLAAQEGRVG